MHIVQILKIEDGKLVFDTDAESILSQDEKATLGNKLNEMGIKLNVPLTDEEAKIFTDYKQSFD